MKVKRKAYKSLNNTWIAKRGSEAQWGLLRGFKFDDKLGRTGKHVIHVPAIPYERFIMHRLFEQGYGCY